MPLCGRWLPGRGKRQVKGDSEVRGATNGRRSVSYGRVTRIDPDLRRERNRSHPVPAPQVQPRSHPPPVELPLPTRYRDHVLEHSSKTAGVRTRVAVPLRFADGYAPTAEVFTFTGLADGEEHLALGLGNFRSVRVPLVRAHSECLTGDVFGSARCDCGPQLREATERIATAGGDLLYLRPEGRRIRPYAKPHADGVQDTRPGTHAAHRALPHAARARDQP